MQNKFLVSATFETGTTPELAEVALRAIFAVHGEVSEVIHDRDATQGNFYRANRIYTLHVIMEIDRAAAEATQATLTGSTHDGLQLKVELPKVHEPRGEKNFAFLGRDHRP